MSLKIGNLAPNFKLKNQDGELVELKSFRGKKNVIVYFYPKAMTPGCTNQACGLRDYKRKLSSKKTIALGISPDSVERLKKFEGKEKLNFDLLSDLDHKIADKYYSWGLKKFMGREYDGILRQTFIINKEGRLAFILDKIKTKSHHDDVLKLLEDL